MGLKQKLDDTVFRSLKYGGDTPGGGSSGQPYIKPPDLNKVDNTFNSLRFTRFDDGLVRGGAVGALNASITDTLRIGKFLKDFPKGPLFITKQVGLQLSNPKLEIRQQTDTTTNKIGPTRVYNLGINTLAQVGVNAFGQHIVRHGFLPSQNENDLYINVVRENDKDKNSKLIRTARKLNYINDQPKRIDITRLTNRQNNNILGLINTNTLGGLAQGLNNFLTIQNQTIDNYIGGPSSVYGIGSTTIRRYEPFLITPTKGAEDAGEAGYKANIKLSTPNFEIQNAVGYGDRALSNYNGIKNDPNQIKNATKQTVLNNKEVTYTNLSNEIQTKIFGKALNKNIPNIRSEKNGLVPSRSFNDYEDSTLYPSYNGSNNGIIINNYPDKKKDFNEREEEAKKQQYKILSSNKNPSFDKVLYSSYTSGQQNNIINGGTTQKKYSIFTRKDRITYDNNGTENTNTEKILLLSFNPLDPFTGIPMPDGKINFSGYIQGYNESYQAEWGNVRYIGRGEKFYIYQGQTRTGGFSFWVPNFNRNEKDINKDKCDWLSKITGGKYNNRGLLGGIITKINLGNYLIDTPVIINSFEYSVPDESPWDIEGIDSQKRAVLLKITVSYNIIGDTIWAYRDMITRPTSSIPPVPVIENEDPVNISPTVTTNNVVAPIIPRVDLRAVPDSTLYRFSEYSRLGGRYNPRLREYGGGNFSGGGAGVSY
jgi:hypothetical protein